MSILIKGMEMPTCCEECAFVKTVGLDRWKCELSGCDFNSWDVGWADGTENKYIRHSSCPLAPVPPHGRLIDADALKASLTFAEQTAKWAVPALRAVLTVIDEMPTIIPTERESK